LLLRDTIKDRREIVSVLLLWLSVGARRLLRLVVVAAQALRVTGEGQAEATLEGGREWWAAARRNGREGWMGRGNWNGAQPGRKRRIAWEQSGWEVDAQ